MSYKETLFSRSEKAVQPFDKGGGVKVGVAYLERGFDRLHVLLEMLTVALLDIHLVNELLQFEFLSLESLLLLEDFPLEN